MAGEIEAALVRMEQRKLAAGIEFGNEGVGDGDDARRAWSGLDLDVDEVKRLMPLIHQTLVRAALQGLPMLEVSTSLYFDGIATGLLIAEARAKAAVA